VHWRNKHSIFTGRKEVIYSSPLGHKRGHPNGITRLNWIPVIKQFLSYKNREVAANRKAGTSKQNMQV
jgi:hypothetical protein